jgi:hypothetical protein
MFSHIKYLLFVLFLVTGKPNETHLEKLLSILARIISVFGSKMQKERWQVKTTGYSSRDKKKQ